MKRIKDWLADHETLGTIIILLLVYGVIDLALGFVGKTYEKFYPNKYSYTYSIEEFKRICSDYKVQEEDEYSSEFYKIYDNKAEAINDFMRLVLFCDGIYANGKTRHWYLCNKERVYRCWDKDKKLIAIRLLKHKRMGVNWKPNYELSFYVEK